MALRRGLAVALTVLVAGCSPSPGTALRVAAEHGWITSHRVGDVFSDGLETLDVADGPITLRDVRTLGGAAGVTEVGFRLVPPGSTADVVQEMPGFPPAVTGLRDGAGTALGGGESWGLIVGYRVDVDARWERTGLEVIYERAGQTYRQVLPATLIVCTPSTPSADCWDDRLGKR